MAMSNELLTASSLSHKASPAISYGTLQHRPNGDEEAANIGLASSDPPTSSSRGPHHSTHEGDEPNRPNTNLLHRGLSSRQVQMIAIAGTIGTGLFLGTGRSLAQGGPASMLICYTVVGFIVYITLLLLGEMATQYPVAGSFNAYATRFVSPAYGWALSWNYWFNDAVSVASDLTAAQLVLGFWLPGGDGAGAHYLWAVSLAFWIFLVGMNSIHVKVYGELEYWLAFLKVVTIVIFIILGILVNAGVNKEHRYIGSSNWRIPGAPFIGGFGGFVRVFVTASFAYGGTESLGITAGETKNPSKNMPRVVNFVFWRILIFYILSILLIGLNVPWNYPNLSTKSTATSPFTIVFQMAGSTAAGSFMNTVILTSVLSAGNHALFAGTRVLYGLSVTVPRQAPAIFSRTTANGVPLPALLMTSSISILCFGSSFIGSGALWGWLQNIVGVSNQIAWFSIGLASWRFRQAWLAQKRPISELKFRAGWTWPWGPPFVVIAVTCIILIQGWSSFSPKFSAVDFISFYIQIPIMITMFLVWVLFGRPPQNVMRPEPDQASVVEVETLGASPSKKITTTATSPTGNQTLQNDSTPRGPAFFRRILGVFVDVNYADLRTDEYQDPILHVDDDEGTVKKGPWRYAAKLYSWIL